MNDILTDDADRMPYGCDSFDTDPYSDYDPMYSGPDDRHWKEDMFEDMPRGFGMNGDWDRTDSRQKVTKSMRLWAERYWGKLVDECPSPEQHDVEHARKLFIRWAIWAKKVTTSNRKRP